MRFTLTINSGNAAMQTGADIAAAVRAVAERIDDPTQYFDDPTDESGFDRSGQIRDVNGNLVGAWRAEK